MKKIVRSVLLIALAAILLSATAFAAQPRWTNVATISSDIDKIGDEYACLINGNPGTTKIVCTMVLYEKNWLGQYIEISKTSSTYNGISHEFVGNCSMQSNKTYKLTISATVTCNGTNETVSDSIVR